MDNQTTQPLSSEQKIKKAKIILWLGITVIIAVGLAIAVFLIFYRSGTDNNINNSKSTALFNGLVSTACLNNAGCILVDSDKDYSYCCPVTDCPDYSLDRFIAVNKAALDGLIATASEPCARKDMLCPPVTLVACPTTNNSEYSAKCLDLRCVKVFEKSE